MSMGIYLPNMELPTSCRSCRFAGFGGRRCELNVCIFTGESQPTLSKERMSACPLVPVPPHGRLLIDADALANALAHKTGACWNCSSDNLDICKDCWLDWLKEEVK